MGAVAAFVGLVRDINDAAVVSALTLEHYPGMTEKALARIVDEAKSRWNVYEALGDSSRRRVEAADQIVLVVVTGAHRVARHSPLRIHRGLPEDARPVLEEGATPAGERWVERARATTQSWLGGAARGVASRPIRRMGIARGESTQRPTRDTSLGDLASEG